MLSKTANMNVKVDLIVLSETNHENDDESNEVDQLCSIEYLTI